MPATYKEPDDFSFDLASFTENPAYKFAQQQGTGQVLAGMGRNGARQSGAALKALQDRGQQTAYSFYAPERDAAYSRHTNDRNFLRGNFESDRGYEYQQGRDEVGDARDARDFGYQQTRDARGDSEWDQTFGYTKERDAVGDARDQRDFDYGAGRDAVGDARDARDFDYGVGRDERGDYETDRGFNYGVSRDARGDYETDRGFDYGVARDARGDYESDRGFNYTSATDNRNFERANYDTDRAFDRGAYQDDRNYLTSRYDRYTDDLFRVGGLGADAAGATSNAGQNYANNASGIVQGDAANQGNAAIAGANATTSLLGAGVNALGYYYGQQGTGGKTPPFYPGPY